ncbi:hypothetical protein PHMEG_0005743 [Phytophthora megakarya]|uniref:Uncharacterized protein n=1 Tax=Phytophthora megakarya TaxID=4795 RepID=A0A225WRY0_9STRA|nr:hypothetical protein PHMEG_0005743 [Phytophthora megakarya]
MLEILYFGRASTNAFFDNKLLSQWIGPFKVIEVRPHSFVIQHLITGREYDVHSSRLKFYADSELNQTTELMELVSRQGMVLGVEAYVIIVTMAQ